MGDPETLRRMGEHLRDVRNQFDAGLVPPNDVLTVQAQEARQRMRSSPLAVEMVPPPLQLPW